MPGLNVAMLTGENALKTRQTELNTIGHNLANASRTEYHRQNAAVQEAEPYQNDPGMLGTGTHVTKVVRSYNQSLESSLQNAVQENGYNQAKTNQLQLIEESVAPDGDSTLNKAIQEFSAGWQEVANAPENQEKRNALIEKGKNMAEQFNLQREKLTQLRNDIADSGTGDGYVKNKVEKLNGLSEQVADLNGRIKELENRLFKPQQANDLRDRRDSLVNEMAKLAGVEKTEEGDSTYTVSLGGNNLVQGSSVEKIQVNPSGGIDVEWASTGNAVTLGGGEIQGLLDARSRIADRIEDFDQFARELREFVNQQHQEGEDLNGNGGIDFLNWSGSQLSVNVNDPESVAASGGSGPGDGTNAQEVWNALHSSEKDVDGDGSDEIVDYDGDGNSDEPLIERTNNIINDIAREVSLNKDVAEGSENSVQMFEKAVSRESGVNQDEEMTKMLETQRAYQASARFISVVDGMLASALQMV